MRGIKLYALALLAVLVPAVALAAPCIDCNGDGALDPSELSGAVAVALGTAEASSCTGVDVDASGGVTVDEIVAAVAVTVSGCAPVSTPTVAATSQPTPTATPTPSASPSNQLPPTSQAALMAWLEEGSYLGWHAESAPHPSAGPHFGTIRTFINNALFDSLTLGTVEHPQGAAAVKELYGPSGNEVRGWAVMVKIEATSSGGQGWYWYEGFDGFGGGGIGSPVCTGCHSLGRDYVRIPFPLQ